MALTMEQLKDTAPAVFAKRPASIVSQRYQYVPTTDVINLLRKDGWFPMTAEQRRTRKLDRRPYAKHLVRFRHKTATGVFKGGIKALGQAYPELVVVNSHNATSPYQLCAGFHVAACMNGLVVAEEVVGSIRVPHLVAHKNVLLAAADTIRTMLKNVTQHVRSMRARRLTRDEQVAFAKAVLKLQFPAGNSPFTTKDILAPRRTVDDRDDLWAIFNIVQENLMAGDTHGLTASGRRYTSRPVGDVNRLVGTNQSLWALAETFLPKKAR